MKEYRDCEYGDYRDIANGTEDFTSTKYQREWAARAYEIVRDVRKDTLDEIAEHFGLNPSEWDSRDYDYFEEELGLSIY